MFKLEGYTKLIDEERNLQLTMSMAGRGGASSYFHVLG